MVAEGAPIEVCICSGKISLLDSSWPSREAKQGHICDVMEEVRKYCASTSLCVLQSVGGERAGGIPGGGGLAGPEPDNVPHEKVTAGARAFPISRFTF